MRLFCFWIASTVYAQVIGISRPVLPAPTASPVGGTFATPQIVTLTSSVTGATICYTVDGSTPAATLPGTCSSGMTYTAPFTVAVTSTINAMATMSGEINSAVLTSTYTISFSCSGLPGCVLWLLPDASSTAGPQCGVAPCVGGGQVTGWLDSSSAGHNAGPITASANCIYATPLLNGHGGVEAAPVASAPSGTATCSMSLSPTITWNTSYTVFAVYQLAGAGFTGSLIGPGVVGATQPPLYRAQNGAANQQQLGRPGGIVILNGSTALTAATNYQTNASYNGTTGAASLRLNRQPDGSATITPVATAGNIVQLFQDAGGANPFGGRFTGIIFEMIVYIPELSPTDITTVEAYLNAKYGI